MMRRLAMILCGAAGRLLPAARDGWADAMVAELAHAESDRAALGFAGGCLLAAARERVRDVDTGFAAGLWAIAVVTAMFAVLRLECAARGMAVLLGASDGMHEALVRQGASQAVLARYDFARPIVVGGFVALGAAQLAGAWFLSQRQLRRALVAWCAALLAAAIVTAVQLAIVWAPDGVPSEFHALLVQTVTLPALLAWFRRRKDRLERL